MYAETARAFGLLHKLNAVLLLECSKNATTAYCLFYSHFIGYESEETLTVICNSNGKWSNLSSAICKRKRCEIFGNLLNGRVDKTEVFFGDRLFLTCNTGET